jgi:hypothetical protein
MTRRTPLSRHPQSFVLYLEGLLNPRLWVAKADDLLEASKLLEPHLRQFWSVITTNANEGQLEKGSEHPSTLPPNVHGPYFILVSYALENLLKALIVGQRNDEISSQFIQTGRLPTLLKEHDLVRLSKEANMVVDVKEEDILTRLSRQSRWKSRYPVPVELRDIQNVIRYSDGRPYFTDYYAPTDLDQLNAMVQKVRSRVAVNVKGLG